MSNILILMADQLRAAALPAYGNPVAKTPHIDSLADRSVLFDSAYCNTPLCAPSRAVLMSGCLPSGTGVYDNAAELPADVPTFAHYLRQAGYRCILAGKMHFCGPDQLHGFEERLTTDIYPADFGWTPDWTRPEERPDWYHNMDSVTLAGPCVRTNQTDFDEEVVFAARRRLFDIVRGNDRRPFCMVVSLTHPHDPFVIPRPWWDRYEGVAIDAPRAVIPPERMDPHSRRLRHVYALDAQPVTEAEIMAARRAYYGAVSFVDDQVGAMLETLDQAGLRDDTIVMLLADHGEMLGDHGLWYKMSFLEGAARVPLLISVPGRFRPHRVAAPASLADILPTLAEIAGDGRAPDYAAPLDGSSLLPWLDGADEDRTVLGEYLAEGVVAPMVAIRRGMRKFIHTPTDPDQLFDLATNPDETRNLAGDATLAASFRAEVAARWDIPALHQAVLASQRRRHLVSAALRRGAFHSWDYQPFEDAGERYIRNHMKLDDLEAAARFPRVAPAAS